MTALGLTQGATLRRIARDLDSTDLLISLAAPANRPVRRLAVAKLQEAIEGATRRQVKRLRTLRLGRASPAAVDSFAKFDGKTVPTAAAASRTAALETTASPSSSAAAAAANEAAVTAVAWPSSAEATQLVERRGERAKALTWLLLRGHVQRQVAAGWRGAAAVSALVYVVMRVATAAVVRAAARAIGISLSRVLPSRVTAVALAVIAGAAAILRRSLLSEGSEGGDRPAVSEA